MYVVTSIGGSAFYGCTSLESVKIGNSVGTIYRDAFNGCISLKSVTIPASVTSIGESALQGCTGLNKIVSLNSNPPTGVDNCFLDVPSECEIIVPENSVSAYKSAPNWDYFKNIVALSSMNLDDTAPFTATEVQEGVIVTYTRTVNSDNWMGVCLPFDLEYSEWAEQGVAATLSDATGETLDWTILEDEDATIAAGTPFIFKPQKASEVIFKSSGSTLMAARCLKNVTYGSVTLRGTFAEKSDMFSTGAYALSGNAFRQASKESQTLLPYRVFITLSEPAPSNIRCRINGEDETAIDGLKFTPVASGRAYSIQGVEVGAGYKGIVIVNGKKVLRK